MRLFVRFAGLLGVLVLALACGRPETTPRPFAVRSSPLAAPAPADDFVSSSTYATVATPIRLRIPAMHVNSRIVDLGLQSDGAIQVPGSTAVAGWYDRGPRPGQPGPAVILGHVDSTRGPGIFFDLYRIRAGTLIEVDRSDGSTASFRVTKISKVAKTRFPTDLVYAPTLDPTLRLVTCGGSFDPARGSYRDNVIAFAEAA
jgi:sortase (surface protein transpeptidase)